MKPAERSQGAGGGRKSKNGRVSGGQYCQGFMENDCDGAIGCIGCDELVAR